MFGASWLHFPLLFQAAVKEVANLSLVSSACDVVSAAYASTKERHPYLRSVCDAAERGVQNVTEAMTSCVQPVLATLEPHGKSLGRDWEESWGEEMLFSIATVRGQFLAYKKG